MIHDGEGARHGIIQRLHTDIQRIDFLSCISTMATSKLPVEDSPWQSESLAHVHIESDLFLCRSLHGQPTAIGSFAPIQLTWCMQGRPFHLQMCKWRQHNKYQRLEEALGSLPSSAKTYIMLSSYILSWPGAGHISPRPGMSWTTGNCIQLKSLKQNKSRRYIKVDNPPPPNVVGRVRSDSI